MKVLLFGATGMVGAGALLECLEDPRVESVLAISRSPTGRTHPKLREVIRQDFFAYEDLQTDFATSDACFFCLGVSSVGMSEAPYTRLTYDLTLAAARAMVTVNPRRTFCYVSGDGYRQLRAGPEYVGSGERQNRERSPGAPLPSPASALPSGINYNREARSCLHSGCCRGVLQADSVFEGHQ